MRGAADRRLPAAPGRYPRRVARGDGVRASGVPPAPAPRRPATGGPSPGSARGESYLGIDIGGTGIKGAPVDIAHGRLLADRVHIPTPVPSRPEAVAEVVATISHHFGGGHHIGCTFPGVVMRGVVRTAANLDHGWIGVDAHALLGRATHRAVTVLNDADAAGLAEMAFGAGRQRAGVVLMVTLGTGIGSALFVDGVLVPNTEFGHLEIRGKDAERRASARAREVRRLSWRRWATYLDEYLGRVEALVNPDLVIVGGGISARADRFLPRLRTQGAVMPAQLQNEAGIVGAALHVRATMAQLGAGGLAPARRRTGAAAAGTGATRVPRA